MNWNHVSSQLVTLNWKYLFFFLLLCFVVYLLMFPLQEGFQEMVEMYERERKENVDGDGEGEDVDSDPKEGFQIPSSCPNVLIQNGSKFFLYNTTRMDVPGVNPIEFENLEEYVEFIKYQKKMGMNCPILYLQQSMGVQGNMEYRLRPDVLEPQAGLNPMLPSQMTSITPYERKMANDNLAQTIAHNLSTSPPMSQNDIKNLDLTKSTLGLSNSSRCTGENDAPPLVQGKSPDPMQENWGGLAFSEKLVDSGYYAGNEIYKVTPGIFSMSPAPFSQPTGHKKSTSCARTHS